jgi:hypothetical protein
MTDIQEVVRMRLEELESLSKEDLRQKANEAFAQTETSYVAQRDRDKYYSEARFYVDEIERRSTSWVSIRDFVLEVVVIALIGWEIYMGYRQETQQSQSFQQEQAIWKNMEASSDATAKQSQATARQLESVNQSMESTKNAVQGQLAVSYDPSVLVQFLATQMLHVLNNGGCPDNS